MNMRRRPRAYRMTVRADSAAETGRRIVDAAYALFLRDEYEDVTLQDVADQAGVTMQTVLRRFRSKDGLVAAVLAAKLPDVVRSRAVDRPGDVAAAVRVLVDHYEATGDLNWRMLRQEHRFPALHEVLVVARATHLTWIEEALAPLLPARGRRRERRILALFTATDFYQWKLMRRDLGRSRADAERIMVETVRAIAEEDT